MGVFIEELVQETQWWSVTTEVWCLWVRAGKGCREREKWVVGYKGLGLLS